jgi:hypothetical protein
MPETGNPVSRWPQRPPRCLQKVSAPHSSPPREGFKSSNSCIANVGVPLEGAFPPNASIRPTVASASLSICFLQLPSRGHCTHTVASMQSQLKAGCGVIWNIIPCETPVIPAKAGIHSTSLWKLAVYRLDSRFRGNDQVSKRMPFHMTPLPPATFA